MLTIHLSHKKQLDFLKKIAINVVHRVTNKNNVLNNIKDKRNNMQDFIFKIECKQCQTSYII